MPRNLLVNFPGISTRIAAQEIFAITDYKIVAPGDTLQLTYLMDGTSEDFKNFKAPLWKGLTYAGGPYQSQTTSNRFLNGKSYKSQSVEFSYKLRATSEGNFVIGSAQVYYIKGKTLHFDSIAITVKNGYKKKPGIMQDMQLSPSPDMFATDWPMSTSYEHSNRSLLMKPHIRIEMSNKKYLLIAGWSYLPEPSVHIAEKLLSEVAVSLRQRKDVLLVDSLLNIKMPRYYFVLDDTTGIRTSVERMLAKSGPQFKSTIILSPIEDWNTFRETCAFDYDNEIHTVVFNFTTHKEFAGLARKHPVRKLEIRLRFGTKAQKEAFNTRAKIMGYHVNATDTTSDTIAAHYYIGHYTISTPMKQEAIYKSIATLAREAGKEEYRAVFFGLSLLPFSKKD